jgi:hypothetical protein
MARPNGRLGFEKVVLGSLRCIHRKRKCISGAYPSESKAFSEHRMKGDTRHEHRAPIFRSSERLTFGRVMRCVEDDAKQLPVRH